MLRKIHLYGNLAQTYGEVFKLDVNSVGESLLALNANFPGFLDEIRIGKFHVFKGDINSPIDLGENTAYLLFNYPDGEDFHIMPAIEGAGGDNGWLSIIIGVILIAATWYVGGAPGYVFVAEGIWGAVGALGVSLVLTGIAQLMSPTPQLSTDVEREEEKPSFVFNGPINRTEQGGPVTLVYGEIITGSVIVGGSIDIEEYA